MECRPGKIHLPGIICLPFPSPFNKSFAALLSDPKHLGYKSNWDFSGTLKTNKVLSKGRAFMCTHTFSGTEVEMVE